MIEIPEAATISAQITDFMKGAVISGVKAAQSPHKFAWYQGEPESYPALLTGRAVSSAKAVGGMVEISLDGAKIVLSEGAYPVFLNAGEQLPEKHQLLLQFENGSILVVSVRMYGGILAFLDGKGDNEYYLMAKEKPSPLTDTFNEAYFSSVISFPDAETVSAKVLLATEQRIPGLGNGTLQDILYKARVHPKRKTGALTDADRSNLFNSVKTTLAEMTAMGGRNTENDLFGHPGGYPTRCSKLTVGSPCAVCGDTIIKASYMGGSVYFCPTCQPQ